MIVAVHQPNFLPWVGYFYKMDQADAFVYLDDVQYIRRGFQNRNRIRTRQGVTWLTVPVQNKGNWKAPTHTMGLDPDPRWRAKHLGTLQAEYGSSPHYKSVMEVLSPIYESEWSRLAPFCEALLECVRTYLRIETPLYRSSDFPGDATGTDRLLDLCRHLKATTYLSGTGGKKYQDEAQFEAAGIQVRYSDFKPAPYAQMHEPFEGGMSVLDAMFNLGPESSKLLRPPPSP